MLKRLFPSWLHPFLPPVRPANLLLFGTLLALPMPSLAQCGCRDLHLAMTGNRQYQYRSYQVGKSDTATVALFRDDAPQRSFAPPQRRFSRPQAWLRLPQFSEGGFRVEVTDSVTKQHMWLTFSYPPLDALDYAFLLDFAAGRHYHIALEKSSPPPGFEVTVTKWSDNSGKQWLLLRKK